jgi:hypothetical protein
MLVLKILNPHKNPQKPLALDFLSVFLGGVQPGGWRKNVTKNRGVWGPAADKMSGFVRSLQICFATTPCMEMAVAGWQNGPIICCADILADRSWLSPEAGPRLNDQQGRAAGASSSITCRFVRHDVCSSNIHCIKSVRPYLLGSA